MLQNFEPDHPTHLLHLTVHGIRDFLETNSYLVTLKVSDDILELLGDIEADGRKSLTSDDAEKIGFLYRTLFRVIKAEVSEDIVWSFTEKRLGVEKLREDVSALFAEGVFSSLPQDTRFDFSEAGKCISFERPTAAAFHLMRGLEAFIRHFYVVSVRRGRLKDNNWFRIVQHMSDKKVLDKSVCNHLQHIRDNFRNPTAHPDKFYDIEEAQDLFSLTVEVANRLVGHEKWSNA
ncbi:DUF4145 domain-containing protein [Thalassospira lohafexi]|nr:DUF4145 domain-containing protein [Thalassospira lohafexi]